MYGDNVTQSDLQQLERQIQQSIWDQRRDLEDQVNRMQQRLDEVTDWIRLELTAIREGV